MKDAESDPSPRRFCSKLGMRKAAAKASAAGPRARVERSKDSRIKPAIRERKMPKATVWVFERFRTPCLAEGFTFVSTV